MNEHILDFRMGGDERLFDALADGVAGLNGDVWVDADTNVDNDVTAMGAGQQLIDPRHTGDGRGRPSKLFNFFLCQHLFHHDVRRLLGQRKSDFHDDERDEHPCQGVPIKQQIDAPAGTREGASYADESCDGRVGVRPVVPRFGHKSCTAVAAADAKFVAK